MSEHIKCEDCGGYFLEDYCACTCDKKKVRKLKRKLEDLERIFYAYAMGDIEDLPQRLQAKLKEMSREM